jgi:hypothetical protein
MNRNADGYLARDCALNIRLRFVGVSYDMWEASDASNSKKPTAPDIDQR